MEAELRHQVKPSWVKPTWFNNSFISMATIEPVSLQVAMQRLRLTTGPVA